MHLLYLDESGSASEAGIQHFVLAGVSFFERSTHWTEQKLNEVVQTVAKGGDIHDIELHGSPMHGGRGFWRRLDRPVRQQTIRDALQVGIGDNHHSRVFAAVIRRDKCPAKDIVEHAFEEICRRYDVYLGNMHRVARDTQRGIMIFDKCSTENRIQRLARTFKYEGHASGKTRNYAEVPLFLDSKASRLIQLADLVAYAFHKSYEHGDNQYLDIIRPRIHRNASPASHGLYECL